MASNWASRNGARRGFHYGIDIPPPLFPLLGLAQGLGFDPVRCRRLSRRQALLYLTRYSDDTAHPVTRDTDPPNSIVASGRRRLRPPSSPGTKARRPSVNEQDSVRPPPLSTPSLPLSLQPPFRISHAFNCLPIDRPISVEVLLPRSASRDVPYARANRATQHRVDGSRPIYL